MLLYKKSLIAPRTKLILRLVRGAIRLKIAGVRSSVITSSSENSYVKALASG